MTVPPAEEAPSCVDYALIACGCVGALCIFAACLCVLLGRLHVGEALIVMAVFCMSPFFIDDTVRSILGVGRRKIRRQPTRRGRRS